MAYTVNKMREGFLIRQVTIYQLLKIITRLLRAIVIKILIVIMLKLLRLLRMN